MNDCTGLMGRIFGHRIQRVLVKEEPVEETGDIWSNPYGHMSPSLIRRWVLVCARCGKMPVFEPESAEKGQA